MEGRGIDAIRTEVSEGMNEAWEEAAAGVTRRRDFGGRDGTRARVRAWGPGAPLISCLDPLLSLHDGVHEASFQGG